MSHGPGILVEGCVCRVTGVLFNTATQKRKKKKKKKRFMAFFSLWRPKETAATLGLKPSLDLGCNHIYSTITNKVKQATMNSQQTLPDIS